MSPYDPDQPLISLHVPKCAGTSMFRVLRWWFGFKLLKHYPNKTPGRLPKKHRLTTFTGRPRRGLCIHGHFDSQHGFGCEDYYPRSNQLITILRDPFDTVLSNFYYGKSRAQRGITHPYVDFATLTLEEYLQTSKHYIVQMLLPQLTIDNYRTLLQERFLYIGIAEDMQASMNNLASILNKRPRTVSRRNTTTRPTDAVDPALVEAWKQRHELEIALYQYAKMNYQKLNSGQWRPDQDAPR